MIDPQREDSEDRFHRLMTEAGRDTCLREAALQERLKGVGGGWSRVGLEW